MDMIPTNKQDAERLAQQYLAKMPIAPDDQIAIKSDETIETDFGWLFFWNSKKYLETDDFSYALVGNTPLIVDRRDGSIHETSTADPVEVIIELYRRTHQVVRS